MPRGDKHELRVLTGSFKPGERMVFHRHRSPVTVVILEGAVTLDSGGCRSTMWVVSRRRAPAFTLAKG